MRSRWRLHLVRLERRLEKRIDALKCVRLPGDASVIAELQNDLIRRAQCYLKV
jgi:hypothetical protein